MTTPPTQTLPSTARLEAFSDGVLAIAITLLVLELHAPTEPGSFGPELTSEWPSYIAYVATFAIIGTAWLTHHALFARLRNVDGPILLTNLGFLFFASIMPFPAGLVSAAFRTGEKSDQTIAMLVFIGVSMSLSGVWLVLTHHVSRSPGVLSEPGYAQVVQRGRRQETLALVPPVIGAALAFLSPLAALALQAVTPLLYLASIAASYRVPHAQR